MLIGVLFAIIGIALLTIACCSPIINELIPRRAVVTPILSMNIDMSTREPQSGTLTFRYSGRYSVNAELELRHGPQGDYAEHAEVQLAGVVEISDANGVLRMERAFEHRILDYVSGVRLLEFDTDESGMKGEKVFKIRMILDDRFRQNYSSMSLFIRKEMKYPILD